MTIRCVARGAGVLVAAALGGCANYRAVSDFSTDTGRVTDTVRDEFKQLESLCVRQAELVLVVNNIQSDGPLAQCDRYRRTQARFASLTIDVLDGYAEALADLADDRAFDLTPAMRRVGTRVRALQDSGGNAVIPDTEAAALSRVATLLADLAASRKRDDAVRRMAAATPDLTVMGRALKAFFVSPSTASSGQPSDAPADTTRAPYANFVSVIASSTTSTQQALQSAPMRKAEPIRTAELLRDLRGRQKLLDRRNASGPDAIPVRIAAAIDAWLAAVDQFAVDAMKPDSRELIERMKRLRDATRLARDAVAGTDS